MVLDTRNFYQKSTILLYGTKFKKKLDDFFHLISRWIKVSIVWFYNYVFFFSQKFFQPYRETAEKLSKNSKIYSKRDFYSNNICYLVISPRSMLLKTWNFQQVSIVHNDILDKSCNKRFLS